MALNSGPAADPPSGSSRAIALAVGLVILLLVAGVTLYYLIISLDIVPPSDALWLRIAVVGVLGYLGLTAIGRVIFVTAERWAGTKHAGLIQSAYRLVAYIVLAVVILYAAGINGYALLAGGTFAGLVIGLASQSALANFVSGVVLLVARPFEPGDRVTIVSAQFSFLLPSYPPKFFSQDLLMPGFTGRVEDIGMVFTLVRLDDGPVVTLPNSLVINAAVVGHSLAERWVRTKVEVPPSIPPETLLPLITKKVQTNEWVVRPELARAYVNQATLTSYVVSIDVMARGNLEEPPRSSIYVEILRLVREMTPAPPKGAAPGGPPTPPSPPAAPTSSPAAPAPPPPNPNVSFPL